MAAHNDLGAMGEEKAVDHLVSNGYKIKQRNWRSGRYELDIVAEKDGCVVVVEVKTRKSSPLVSPVESVGKTKIRNIVMGANAYVHRFNISSPVRFDVISMTINSAGAVESFEHLEDAFLPSVNM